MGILGLSKFIGDHAPGAIKEADIKNYFGRKIAVDASASLYQFLVAIRQDGVGMVNEDGETTSHLIGMFYRTIRMVENGLKPIYVFDGKPPTMKSGELAKRADRRATAQKGLEKAIEEGDASQIDKFNRRLVKVTKSHVDDSKTLLGLMGIPFITAPSEAEAQCSELVKKGKAFAVGSEDMDTLTFGATILLRNLSVSDARKLPVKEYNLSNALARLNFTMNQFIDLCILLGCDYCGSIRGIGPKKAIDLIDKHKTIDEVLLNIDQAKYPPPEDWKFKEARELFVNPEIDDATDLEIKWCKPDVEELVTFMVARNGFNEDRIRNGIKKLEKARGTTQQGRLDSFFPVIANPSNGALKRKSEPVKSGSAKKLKGRFKPPK